MAARHPRPLGRLDIEPELTQLTGLFHAGAIIALADETVTAAAMWETNPTAESVPSSFGRPCKCP
ncbi:MAG TPA: hypothetical protein VGD07_00730 [Methylomirabilota bacterium]|jgi:acyl-coenzyme A thioesterase PaaI-like protein